jgi:hypothetical protein
VPLIVVQGSQRSPVNLVVILWGAIQVLKSGLDTSMAAIWTSFSTRP